MIENVLGLITVLAIGGGALIIGIWVFLHFFDD
jgi:hypothetical protein